MSEILRYQRPGGVEFVEAKAYDALAARVAELEAANERLCQIQNNTANSAREAERALRAERDELIALRHQFAEENTRLFGLVATLRAERDEAVKLLREVRHAIRDPSRRADRIDAFLAKVKP